MHPSFAGYLVRLGAVLAGVLIATWLYILALPMAFLPGGYPAWVGKTIMLRECRLGQIAFFGDSRVEAGVIPAGLPIEASNFGVAAGTSIETHSAVRRALGCATTLPQQAVIALSAEQFGPLSRFFWTGTLRYGFISFGELLEAERLADALGDLQSFNASPQPAEFSGRLRDWMYGIHFPSTYFNSLVQGRLVGRYGVNHERLAQVLAARGFSAYEAGGAVGPRDVRAGFTNTPLQAALFEQTLALLQARRVEVALMMMPLLQAPGMDAAREADYLAYMRSMTQRFPNVRLLIPAVPHWPAQMFADGRHLNGVGARLFTERLATCVAAGRLQPGCDVEWHGADPAAQ